MQKFVFVMALALLVLSGFWLVWPTEVQTVGGADLALPEEGLPDFAAKVSPPAPAEWPAAWSLGPDAERKAMERERPLLVTDLWGAPLSDAFVLARVDGQPWVRASADAEGRVSVADLRGKLRLAIAPGYHFALLDVDQREVVLTATNVQVRAANPLGEFPFEGARVRWIADPELLRQCPWLDGQDQWREIDAKAVDFGRLPHRGLDGLVGLEWATVDTCSVVYPMASLDPVDLWSEGVRSERLNLVVPPHASHDVPRLRFQDDQGAALVGVEVRLACNDLWVRAGTTDAQGEVLVDVHAFDEDQRDARLRVELSKGAETSLVAVLSMAELRAQGVYVFGSTRKTIDVKVLTDRPEAFSVALAATHSTASSELRDLAVEEFDDPLEMHPKNALHHARAEALEFHPLDPVGEASLTTPGWSNTRCVILRHNATGLLVSGQCCVSGDALVELDAPKLGQRTFKPRNPTDAPWKLSLIGVPYQYDGLFLASLGEPIEITPQNDTFETPEGGYIIEVQGEHGYQYKFILHSAEPDGTFVFELPTFRLVRGVVQRRFDDAAVPAVVEIQTLFQSRDEIALEPDGSFEVWVADDIQAGDLNLRLRLPESGERDWKVLPLDPDADVLEFVVDEARLRVALPSLAFKDRQAVQISGTGYRNSSTQPVENGFAEFYVQPGIYTAQATFHGAQPIHGLELAAGDDLRIDLPDQDIGAGVIQTDVPPGGFLTLDFFVPTDELNDGEGSPFTLSRWTQAFASNDQALDLIAVAEDYWVTATLRWNVSRTSSVTVSDSFSYKVRANEIGTIEINLLDKLRDKLRAGATTQPHFAAALVKLGG